MKQFSIRQSIGVWQLIWMLQKGMTSRHIQILVAIGRAVAGI
jgi:hypothetical protein